MATKLIILLFTILSSVAINCVSGQQTRTKRMYALCPPKFTKIGNECYYLSNDSANWLDAHFECKDRGSKLAEPFKFEDIRLRKHLIGSDPDRTPKWIGGIYNWERHVWQWGYNGRDMTYQAFSKMKPGSSEDLRFHCAVLNPEQMYRWSSKSCVEKHHFVCQHRMPYVNEKNRDKIYRKWNETFPNEMANEIELQVTDKENENVSNRINRQLQRKRRVQQRNKIPQDPLNPNLHSNDVSSGYNVGRQSRHNRHPSRNSFIYGNPVRRLHHRHKSIIEGQDLERPVHRRVGNETRKKRPRRPFKKVVKQKTTPVVSEAPPQSHIRPSPETTTIPTTTTTEQVFTNPPHRHHHKMHPHEEGHHERHHKHHEKSHRNEVEIDEEPLPRTTKTTTTEEPTTERTTTTEKSTTTSTTTTTPRPTTTTSTTTTTEESPTMSMPTKQPPKTTQDNSEQKETLSPLEKKLRRDKLREKLNKLSPEKFAEFYRLRQERMKKKLAEMNGENK